MAYDNLPIGHVRAESFSRLLVPSRWQWAWDGLVAAIPPFYGAGSPLDIVNGFSGTQSGTITSQYGPAGREANYASASYSDFGDISLWGTLYDDFTIACIHSPIGTAPSAIWCYADDSSAFAPFSLLWSFGTSSKYALWNDNNTNGSTTTSTYAVGSRNFVVGRRTGNHLNFPPVDIFVNGILESTTFPAKDIGWDGSPLPPNRQRINSFGGFSTGYSGGGIISSILLWNRSLSNNELSLLFFNPWGPFQQENTEYSIPTSNPVLFQSLSPDAIATSSNLSGVAANIDDDPDSPDGLWLTATSPTSTTSARVTFPTPIGSPFGTQNFRVLFRKTAGMPTPTASVQLYQGGSLVRQLGTDAAITNTTGQIIEANWDASELTGTLDGSDVEFGFTSATGDNAASAGALPAYVTQGTLDDSATMPATVNVNVPTHSAGNLLLLLVLCRNTNNNGALASINTAGWTQGGGAGGVYGGAQNTRIGFGWKIGDGSETAVSITTTGGTTTDRRISRVYVFTATNGFADPPVGNISSSMRSGTTASTSVSMPTVVPSGDNQLAVTLMASNVVATIAPATGETGGDWVEPVAESPGGANGTIGIQVSDQSGGGQISGGTASITSSQWVAVGMTLIPATIAGSAVNTVELGALEWNVSYQETAPSAAIPPYMYYFCRMRI